MVGRVDRLIVDFDPADDDPGNGVAGGPAPGMPGTASVDRHKGFVSAGILAKKRCILASDKLTGGVVGSDSKFEVAAFVTHGGTQVVAIFWLVLPKDHGTWDAKLAR